jgi:hypothetical protein
MSVVTTTTPALDADTLAALVALGFSPDDVARKQRQRELAEQRAHFAEILHPTLTDLVDKLPFTESVKSAWKGHSIDQMVFEHNGRKYSAKVLITDKGEA